MLLARWKSGRNRGAYPKPAYVLARRRCTAQMRRNVGNAQPPNGVYTWVEWPTAGLPQLSLDFFNGSLGNSFGSGVAHPGLAMCTTRVLVSCAIRLPSRRNRALMLYYARQDNTTHQECRRTVQTEKPSTSSGMVPGYQVGGWV